MKIGIDLRICNEAGYYPNFITELVHTYTQQHPNDTFVLFTHAGLPIPDGDNIKVQHTTLQRKGFFHSFRSQAIFNQESLDLLLLPDHYFPLGYKGTTLTLLPHLKEIFFPSLDYIQHHFYKFMLTYNLRKNKKVVTLDIHTALELNERLNISEDKIEHIHGFFPLARIQKDIKNQLLHIDVRAKHNLKGPYFLYDSGDEVHNNFERILKALKQLNSSLGIPISIIISCESTNRDLDLREKVIEYKIAQNIVFLGEIPEIETASYYQQSLGVIYSSIYESFPFHCCEALKHGSPILLNDIGQQREIFGEVAYYFDPLSIHSMEETLRQAYEASSNKNDYTHIQKKYYAQQSTEELSKIIENIDLS